MKTGILFVLYLIITKKLKPLKFSIIFLLFTLSLIGCKRKQGCTNKDADNYDLSAYNDNGSCVYSVYVSFYKTLNKSREMLRNRSKNIFFYINNNYIGYEPTSYYFTSPPDCNSSQLINSIISLGKTSEKSVLVTVKDENGLIYLDKNFNFFANECTLIEIN